MTPVNAVGIQAAKRIHCHSRFDMRIILSRIHFVFILNSFTEGPVADSISDFWRMVWEQCTATIVILTNLEEKGRVSGMCKVQK